ncbi:MAG: TonB-dependent receptor, partial [bacterium]
GTHVTWVKSPKTFVEFQINRNNSEFTTPLTDRRDRETVAKTIGEVKLDEAPDGYDITWPDRDQLSVYRIAGRRGFTDFSKNTSYSTRLDLTSQVSYYHLLKAGLGFNYYYAELEYGTNSMTDDPDHVENKRNWTERDVKESEWFAYAQDKIEFKGLIMNLGLRLDAFTPLTKDLVYDFDPNTTADYNYWELYKEVLHEGRGFRVTPATHWALSPRVGISHPIGENSKLYFNYGYFYQRPVIFNQYADVRNRRGRLEYLGNPNLDFTKTIAYELGIEQNFFTDFLLRVSAYYKDISRAWGRTYNQISRLDQTIGYKTYLNNRYGDIRGVEITLEKHGRYISGRINYDHMWSSSGLVGQNTYFQDPSEIIYGTDFFNPVAEELVARPRLNAMVTLYSPHFDEWWGRPLNDMSLTLYHRYRAGRHFSWHGSPLYPGTDERDPNNVQWRGDHRTDMRIEKSMKLIGVELKPYLEVSNLLDYKYIYWPEGSGAGFGFNVWPVQDAFTNYMDWIKEEGKTPGDYEGAPPNAISRHQYLLWNQPR